MQKELISTQKSLHVLPLNPSKDHKDKCLCDVWVYL